MQTLHAKLETGETNFNIPKVIKRLIVQIRKGDPMVTIIPFHGTTYKSSETLDKEKELPGDEEKLKTWVENIRKMQFSHGAKATVDGWTSQNSVNLASLLVNGFIKFTHFFSIAMTFVNRFFCIYHSYEGSWVFTKKLNGREMKNANRSLHQLSLWMGNLK